MKLEAVHAFNSTEINSIIVRFSFVLHMITDYAALRGLATGQAVAI